MRKLFAAFLLIIFALHSSAQNSSSKLIGGGATFPGPLYQRWIDSFGGKFPGIAFSYLPVGSGKGVEMLRSGEVDFAASDMPLTSDQLISLPGHVTQIPTVIGGVVPAYHIDDFPYEIRFTPEALAAIFSGKVKRWNDPLLKQNNRNVPLPSRAITVVHRSDASGTSYIFTDYLSKVSPDWKRGVGRGETVSWPTGLAAQGNGGVAELLAKTPDSIGYIEYIYALQHRLNYGSVRNAEGVFVKADINSLPEAARDGKPGTSITNAPGQGAYPIASFTYLLFPARLQGEEEQKALSEFLQWVLTKGQKQARAYGFCPLPPGVAADALQAVESASSQTASSGSAY